MLVVKMRSYVYALPFQPLRSYKLSGSSKDVRGFQFIHEFMRLGFELYFREDNKVFVGVLEGREEDFSSRLVSVFEIFTPNGACRVDVPGNGAVYRLPTLLAVYQRQRFGRGLLRIYRRDFGCKAYDEVRGVALTDVLRDSYGFLMVYRRGGEYYALFDSIFSMFQTKLSGRPHSVKYSNSVAIVEYGDYSSVLSPRGVIDVPFPLDGFESLGGDPAEGTVYLFKSDSRRVFALDKMGVLEPIMLCRRPLSFLNRDGRVSIVCPETGESIGFELGNDVISLLHRLSSIRDRCFVLLPYIVWIGDGEVYAGIAGGAGFGDGYRVFVMLKDEGVSVSVGFLSARIPSTVAEEYLWRLVNDVEEVKAYKLKVGKDLAFLVSGEYVDSIVRVYVKGCIQLSENDLRLCSSDGCVEPLLLRRCGDCCYIAYYTMDGDYLSIGDLRLKVGNPDIVVVNADVRVERVRVLSHKTVMYEGCVEASSDCKLYSLDVVSPSCKLYTIELEDLRARFRVYCDWGWNRLPGLLLLKCRGVEFPLVFPLSRLLRPDEYLGEVRGVDLESLGELDLLLVKATGKVLIEIGGVGETVEGRLALRLPYGERGLLLVDKFGPRSFSYLSPPPPDVDVRLKSNQKAVAVILARGGNVRDASVEAKNLVGHFNCEDNKIYEIVTKLEE